MYGLLREDRVANGKILQLRSEEPGFYSSLWVSHPGNEETGGAHIPDFTELPKIIP